MCIAVVKVCFFMFYLTISQIQKSGFFPQPHILIPHFFVESYPLTVYYEYSNALNELCFDLMLENLQICAILF